MFVSEVDNSSELDQIVGLFSSRKKVLYYVCYIVNIKEIFFLHLMLFHDVLYQNPAELDNWLTDLNPKSKEVISNAYAVPSLSCAVIGNAYQFERLGMHLNSHVNSQMCHRGFWGGVTFYWSIVCSWLCGYS